MKKRDLVSETEKLKGKTVVDNDIKNLVIKILVIKYLICQKISPISWGRMKNLVASLTL